MNHGNRELNLCIFFAVLTVPPLILVDVCEGLAACEASWSCGGCGGNWWSGNRRRPWRISWRWKIGGHRWFQNAANDCCYSSRRGETDPWVKVCVIGGAICEEVYPNLNGYGNFAGLCIIHDDIVCACFWNIVCSARGFGPFIRLDRLKFLSRRCLFIIFFV